jgi:hypothetical protein
MGSRAHPRRIRGAPSLDKVPPFSATRLPFQVFLPLESATGGRAGNQALPNRDMSGSGGAYRSADHVPRRNGYPRRRYPYCVSRSSSQRPSIHNTQLRRKERCLPGLSPAVSKGRRDLPRWISMSVLTKIADGLVKERLREISAPPGARI